MPSIDARILLRRPSSTFTDQEFPSASAEGERPEGDLDKDSSKPSRRKSELPAGTQDPIIRNTSLCDTLLILTSLDKHLASGFSTTYPEQIAQYCDEALWAQFILDINEAARLKMKDRLVIQIRPAVKRIKFLNKAIENRLEKRTKPILNVLKYWQDVLRTYSIQVELRRAGVPLKKKLILPPTIELSQNHHLRSRPSVSFADLSKTVRSSWASARTSLHGSSEAKPDSRSSVSPISLDGLPVRAPFLNSNVSELSLASSRSLVYESPGSSASNKWELVVLTGFKRRSQVASLYSQSRRFSTYSLPQTKPHSRPSSVSMIASEEYPSLRRSSYSRSASSGGPRTSRARTLTLEELAKLPLPASSSPFVTDPLSNSNTKLNCEVQAVDQGTSSHVRAKGSTGSLSCASSYVAMPQRPLPPTPLEYSRNSAFAASRSAMGQDSIAGNRRSRQSYSASGHRRSVSAQAMITAEAYDYDQSKKHSSGSHNPPVLLESIQNGRTAVIVRKQSPQIHSKSGSFEDLTDIKVVGTTTTSQSSDVKSALSKTNSLFLDEPCSTHTNCHLSSSTPSVDQGHSRTTVESTAILPVSRPASQHSVRPADPRTKTFTHESIAAYSPPIVITGKHRRETMATVAKSPLARMSHTPETMLAEDFNSKMRLSTLMTSAASIFSKSLTNLTNSYDYDECDTFLHAGSSIANKPLPSVPFTSSRNYTTSSSTVRPGIQEDTAKIALRGRSATQKKVDFFDPTAVLAGK